MTSTATPDRATIIQALRAALEPLEHVNALWLAGSAAFARDDELSDIDALLDVADARQDDAFAALEAALERMAPIAHRLVVPEPAWHGHSQRVYQLRGWPEHLLIDATVMQRGSSAPRFDERAIHGQPVIVFDKLGVVRARPVDQASHRQAVRLNFERTRTRFFLLRHMPAKEIQRGNHVTALWRYHNTVLTPLITLLRIRHAPLFHDFVPRYLEQHLPEDVYQRVRALYYVASPEDLGARVKEAVAWAEDEIAWLERDGVLDRLDLAEPLV